MRLTDKYNGRDGPHMQLSNWVQAYGKQPAWMHMNFALGNMVNKHVLGGGEICRWLLLFYVYDFKIIVKLGKLNARPDHLS